MPSTEDQPVRPLSTRWVVGIWAVTGVLLTALIMTVVLIVSRDDHPTASGVPGSSSASVPSQGSAAQPAPSETAAASSTPSGGPTPSTPAGTSARPVQPAVLQETCAVQYTLVDQSSGAATIRISITNIGDALVDGWTFSFDLGGDVRVQQGWNGVWTQSGRTVSVRNMTYNAQLAPNQSVTDVGANLLGQTSRADWAPTKFALNGHICQRR